VANGEYGSSCLGVLVGSYAFDSVRKNVAHPRAQLVTHKSRFLTAFPEQVRSMAYPLQKIRPKLTRRIRAEAVASALDAFVCAETPGGIALRLAAQLRPPAPAEYRRHQARRHMRTRLQCAARHPRRSISLPSIATLTRSFATRGLHVPLPTPRRHPRGCLRTAWGRCGALLLHRSGLAPPTPCRSPGAPV
jgi:hypothetical protein